MTETERIGILGGTFNPVHLGHVELGKRLKKLFALDRVLYVLSAQPPHKDSRDIIAPEKRWSMLQVALAGQPGLEACAVEIDRPGPSWTIDTLAQLRGGHPGAAFFFLTGSEGFLTLPTWKDYRAILRQALFTILLRSSGHRRSVLELLSTEQVPLLADKKGTFAPPGAYLVSYDSPWLDLSASMVREKIGRGEKIDQWLTPGVKAVLEEGKLYEKHSDGD